MTTDPSTLADGRVPGRTAAVRPLLASWIARLARRRSSPAFRPDFAEAQRRLLNLGVGGGASDPGGSALRELRERLRDPKRVRCFVDGPTTAALVRRVADDRPEWRAATIDGVRRDRVEGLPIYERSGPQLREGFPWGAIEPGPGGDILHAVRPHRFAFAPRWTLAIAYGEPLAAHLRCIVEDWMQHAAGADNTRAYVSNLVVVQRLLATTWAWVFLGAHPDPDDQHRLLELRLLQVIATDLAFLRPRLGHSHPNNHLLVDRFAGWFAAAAWPELFDGGSRAALEPTWLTEWARQTLPDGSGFEHAQHYHEFACEMAVAYVAMSRCNGWPVEPQALARLQAMLRFQADASGPDGVPLAFGNGTDDPLFPLDAGEAWFGAGLQWVQGSWFGTPVAPAPSEAGLERAFWLLAGAVPEPAAGMPAAWSAAVVYPDGGLAVLPEPSRACVLLRTGPAPGRPVSAGHAHADLLSVHAHVAGKPLLVDAGTFTYRSAGAQWPAGEPAWRRYFGGPRAHNGLAIGEADPLGALDGDFRDAQPHAVVELLRAHAAGPLRWVEARVRSRAPYDGHRRGVIQVAGGYWLVYDHLPDGVADATFGLQAAPGVRVRSDLPARAVELGAGTAALRVVHCGGLVLASIDEGRLQPPAGWVSTRYGQRQPAPQLRYARTAQGPLTAFVMCAGDLPAPRQVEAEWFAGGAAFRLHFDDAIEILTASDAGAPGRDAFGVTGGEGLTLWRSNGYQGAFECLQHLHADGRPDETMEGMNR